MGHSMSFSILLSLTTQLMPVSTECAAALLSLDTQVIIIMYTYFSNFVLIDIVQLMYKYKNKTQNTKWFN